MRLIPITKLVNHEVAYLIKELWEAIDNTNKRLDTLADDNQQLMAQISAKAEQPKPLSVKVGDWVECVAKQGQRKLVDYLGGMGCYKTNYGEAISPGEILRKLSPSEVIVTIGCLSGTVKPSIYDDGAILTDEFVLFQDSVKYATIPLSMLDTPTRELVQSLLKAQEDK